jgi:hypothetical protein
MLLQEYTRRANFSNLRAAVCDAYGPVFQTQIYSRAAIYEGNSIDADEILIIWQQPATSPGKRPPARA